MRLAGEPEEELQTLQTADNIGTMPEVEPTPEPNEKAKQNRRVLIRPATFRQLELLAGRDESEVAELVNRACRELLKAEGLWPPKGGPEE